MAAFFASLARTVTTPKYGDGGFLERASRLCRCFAAGRSGLGKGPAEQHYLEHGGPRQPDPIPGLLSHSGFDFETQAAIAAFGFAQYHDATRNPVNSKIGIAA